MAAVATTHLGRRGGRGAAVRALWSTRTWRATGHLVTGAVMGPVNGVVVLALLLLTMILTPTVVGAMLAMVALLKLNRTLRSWQRSRFTAFLDIPIPRPVPPPPAGPVRRPGLRKGLRDVSRASTWWQLGYHVLAGLFGPLAGVAVVATWSGGLALAATPLYVGGLGFAGSAALTVAGLALLLAAPWVARAMVAVDAAIARRLLGPTRSEELARQVASLATSREGAVDAADAERRRIERDLHDGAQQRLTSLAMNLGIARTALTDLPPAARDVITTAHNEAKQVLAELRDLVRGMHPAVLDNRGLDAALSGLAARSPVPVRLRVSMPARAAREVEAVAYFVVSEALTNATIHADASRIEVTVERRQDRLRVTVVDDGRGGADPERGTGLGGLGNRVRSVDGTLRVDSPAGGPTTVIAELPCES